MNFDTTMFCHVLWIMNAYDYYLFMDRKVMVVDPRFLVGSTVFFFSFSLHSLRFYPCHFLHRRAHTHTHTRARSRTNARTPSNSINSNFITIDCRFFVKWIIWLQRHHLSIYYIPPELLLLLLIIDADMIGWMRSLCCLLDCWPTSIHVQRPCAFYRLAFDNVGMSNEHAIFI